MPDTSDIVQNNYTIGEKIEGAAECILAPIHGIVSLKLPSEERVVKIGAVFAKGSTLAFTQSDDEAAPTPVLAPFDCVITRIYTQDGQYVSPGQTILAIAPKDLEPLVQRGSENKARLKQAKNNARQSPS